MTISKFLAFSQKISDDTTLMDVEDIPITRVVLTPIPKIYKAIKGDVTKNMVNRIYRQIKSSTIKNLSKLMAEITDVKKNLESMIIYSKSDEGLSYFLFKEITDMNNYLEKYEQNISNFKIKLLY